MEEIYLEKICEYCKQPFETRSRKRRFCNRAHTIICPICGKTRIATNTDQLDHPRACSYECRKEKTKQTSLLRYGCTAPGNNPEAREKAKQTCMKNHGVMYALQSKEIRDKGIETNLKKYGTTNPGANLEIINKRMKTNKLRYGDTMPFNKPEAYKKQRATLLARYGVTTGFLTPNALESNMTRSSRLNHNLQEQIIQATGKEVILEKRVGTKLFDLYIPEDSMLIELNPTYTHSCIPTPYLPGVDKYYHRDKTKLALENGFNCMHIWDWDSRTKVIQSMKQRELIDASECSIVVLKKEIYDKFFEANDFAGTCRNIKLCVGLVKDNKVFQAIALGPCTKNKNYDVQIHRMCTCIGYTVTNGYDRLSDFISNYGFRNIIAYVDRSKHAGEEYLAMGMKLKRITPPRKIWSKNTKYINSSMKGTMFDSDEALLADGWLPVYDCGQAVFVFE